MNKQYIAFLLVAAALIAGMTAIVMNHKKENLSAIGATSECIKFDTYSIDVSTPYAFYTVQNICDTNLIFDLSSLLLFPPALESTKCLAPNEIAKTALMTWGTISGTARPC
ncbi:hypothetical protein ABPG72_007551 [Tetrahymena utriculariae]